MTTTEVSYTAVTVFNEKFRAIVTIRGRVVLSAPGVIPPAFMMQAAQNHAPKPQEGFAREKSEFRCDLFANRCDFLFIDIEQETPMKAESDTPHVIDG